MIPRHFRRDALALADRTVDLLVVGGGINGCGVAMEAAQRGLSVLLVEKADVASGTSSRSSKLIHGGLRYLKQLQIRITRESSRERDRYLQLNPELVRPLHFMYPVHKGEKTPGWLVEAGLWMYDRLTAAEREKHRQISPEEARELAPQVDLTDLDRALLYGDAWTDDARLTLAVAETALDFGARMLTRAEVTEGLRDANGRLTGAVVHDLETGRSPRFRARLTVNATGVWVDEIRHRLGFSGRRVHPFRGSHLVLGPGRIRLDAAVTIPSPDDGRPVFFIPHPEGVLVGTTDLDHDGSLDDPRPTAEERDYLLRSVRTAFPGAGVTAADVVGAFAGLRPILGSFADEAETPSKASREEEIWEEDGLLSVAGGKLTTWRLTAQEVVDQATRLLPERRQEHMGPSVSAETPLSGRSPADLEHTLDPEGHLADGVASAMIRRLRGHAPEAMARARSGRELEPLAPGLDLTAAEVREHLATGAVVRLEDLLLRRVRLGMWNPAAAHRIAPRLRPIFEDELGWDDARWDREREGLEAALAGWKPVGP